MNKVTFRSLIIVNERSLVNPFIVFLHLYAFISVPPISVNTIITTEKGVPIVIDSFGKGIEFKKRKDGQYNCTIRVPAFDMKLVAMQHAGFIRVTAPKDLAEEIREDLKKAWEKYDSEA